MEQEAWQLKDSNVIYDYKLKTMLESQNTPEIQKGLEANNGDSYVSVFITTFTTVFLAELGDKTQIATMLLSAQSGKPVVVFLGAALALICSSFVGVILGRWIAKSMPAQRFKYMSVILMVVIVLLLGILAIQSTIENVALM